jgi:hypothetical protein
LKVQLPVCRSSNKQPTSSVRRQGIPFLDIATVQNVLGSSMDSMGVAENGRRPCTFPSWFCHQTDTGCFDGHRLWILTQTTRMGPCRVTFALISLSSPSPIKPSFSFLSFFQLFIPSTRVSFDDFPTKQKRACSLLFYHSLGSLLSFRNPSFHYHAFTLHFALSHRTRWLFSHGSWSSYVWVRWWWWWWRRHV